MEMTAYKSEKKRVIPKERKSVGDQVSVMKARTQLNISRTLTNVKNQKNPASDQASISRDRAQANISRTLANVKKAAVQLAAGDRELATEALKVEQPILHRKADRGPLLKNTAVRKLSRVSKGITA